MLNDRTREGGPSTLASVRVYRRQLHMSRGGILSKMGWGLSSEASDTGRPFVSDGGQALSGRVDACTGSNKYESGTTIAHHAKNRSYEQSV